MDLLDIAPATAFIALIVGSFEGYSRLAIIYAVIGVQCFDTLQWGTVTLLFSLAIFTHAMLKVVRR